MDPSAKVIFGAYQDRRLKSNQVKVTVIATGFNNLTTSRLLPSSSPNPLFNMPDIPRETRPAPESAAKEILSQNGVKREEETWEAPAFLRRKKKWSRQGGVIHKIFFFSLIQWEYFKTFCIISFVAKWKNFERDEAKTLQEYTQYISRNFRKVAAKILKLQPKDYYAKDLWSILFLNLSNLELPTYLNV